jgi:hypothetical protein
MCTSIFFALLIWYANCIFSVPFYSVMYWLYGFSNCIINSTIFRKKLLNIKCVFVFELSVQLLYETLLILRSIL